MHKPKSQQARKQINHTGTTTHLCLHLFMHAYSNPHTYS